MCMICHKQTEVRFISLYVIGSEGLWVCHECEMLIVEFVRELMRKNLNIRKINHIGKVEHHA
jgi:hypothetical protein